MRLKKQKKEVKLLDWQAKVLHGRFSKIVSENNSSETQLLLQKEYLKNEINSLLVAAQDSALRTNWIAVQPDKNHVDFPNVVQFVNVGTE